MLFDVDLLFQQFVLFSIVVVTSRRVQLGIFVILSDTSVKCLLFDSTTNIVGVFWAVFSCTHRHCHAHFLVVLSSQQTVICES